MDLRGPTRAPRIQLLLCSGWTVLNHFSFGMSSVSSCLESSSCSWSCLSIRIWEDIQVLAQCKYSKYLLARQLFSSKPFTLTRGRRRYSTSWGCKGFEDPCYFNAILRPASTRSAWFFKTCSESLRFQSQRQKWNPICETFCYRPP